MGFVNERKEDGTWQTIDRERNIILRSMGRGPDDPEGFILNLDEKEVEFHAFLTIKPLEKGPQGEGRNHIDWHVVEIIAPLHLKQDKSNLHALIEEALDTFGLAASRKYIESISVTFAPNV